MQWIRNPGIFSNMLILPAIRAINCDSNTFFLTHVDKDIDGIARIEIEIVLFSFDYCLFVRLRLFISMCITLFFFELNGKFSS